MQKKTKYIILALMLSFVSCCTISLISKQCENYRIESITFLKVHLYTTDSSLGLDTNNRNYYVLDFKINYCNCKYKFFHTPNPALINGSIENIDSASILDSMNNILNDDIKTLNLKNIFEIANEQDEFPFCSSYVNFNELIHQINTKEKYGSRNRIKDDFLFYIDKTHSCPKKIIVKFASYSIECLVNNNANSFNFDKIMYDGRPMYDNF